MKKVILNAPILGLKGEKVVDHTGNYILNDEGQNVPEVVEVKFGKLALDGIVRSGTENDEQALLAFSLAEKLQANLEQKKPTEMELTDDEFQWVYGVITQQPVIVKARFLQMVTNLNKVAIKK